MILVGRIDSNARVVKAARNDLRLLRSQLPGFAPIIRAIERSFLGFDHGVDNVGIAGRGADTDASHQLRQTVRQFVPGAPAIDRFEDTAFLAAASESPELALKTPHARVKDVGIRRVDIQIRTAVLVIKIERFGPGPTAVRSHEHAPLFIGRKRVPHRGNVNDIRVLGIDDDGRDVFRLFQTHVFPGLPAVKCFVDAIAKRNCVARVRFAGADPNHVRVPRLHGYVADRDGALPLEDRFPGHTAIGRLP